MNFSDINVKCVYTVDFDPVRSPEFDRKHLALVLKKNNDSRTCVVMPLTKVSNGVGTNKEMITVINLPTSLASNPSYAVYNQVRTVNANRFIKLKEGGTPIESSVTDETFDSLFKLMIHDMTHDIPEKRIELYTDLLVGEKTTKIRSLAYDVKNKSSNEDVSSTEIQIRELMEGIEFIFTSSDYENGIDDIINSIVENKLEEIVE
ncbi:conserved protein of unknown function [Petrocella atlantisensis]|uniref:Uncharacterized protein n=2 Tax=Petrocella atlantisensis TaxID=2173034 RepID=A0A3P7PID0_9FIRM|nr:type II toxin-antitoxin system PemK/MazF family toxin [Petrocella atlantisensis]VDN48678.1 conserved protein of unknown function [Petrocella atlantisensis]